MDDANTMGCEVESLQSGRVGSRSRREEEEEEEGKARNSSTVR